MRNLILSFGTFIMFIQTANSQSKILKPVSNEISTSFQVIIQDDTLIGYLYFTKLEKASKDSFNNRIKKEDW